MTIPHFRAMWAVALVLGLGGSALAADGLRMDFDPVFTGAAPVRGFVPIAVDLENLGPDAHGVLRVASEGAQVEYPVDLPRGSHKRLLTYAQAAYDNLHFTLETNQGNVSHEYMPRSDATDASEVLLITDTPGQMAFIQDLDKTNSGGDSRTTGLVDCYARAGSCPTRPVGYSGVTAIVLGSGSERLSDDEVEAIKLWVTSGGILTFVGGASAPILSDPRWADYLPVNHLHLVPNGPVHVLSSFSGSVAPSVTMTSGDLVRGASGRTDQSVVISAEKPHGLGKVVYLSFNPFEAPLNLWSGRRKALTALLRVTDGVVGSNYLQGHAPQGALNLNPVSSSGPPGSGATAGGPAVMVENDPFSMTLPQTSTIFWILAAYFVVVVPVNFLVLRKFKRGELAWFTAPVISLGFAGCLFASTGGLYHAKMSTITSGVLLAQEGDSEGIFLGETQMFIPHAGSYDLGLKGVDMVGTSEDDAYNGWSGGSYPYGGGSGGERLETVDVGEMRVPGLQVNNLTFQRLDYRQRAPVSKWLHLTLEAEGAKGGRCQIVNSGPYVLKDAHLAFGKTDKKIGDLQPGQSLAIPITFGPLGHTDEIPSSDVRAFTTRSERVVLTGNLSGFRPGPQIGQDVPGRSEVGLVLFSEWRGGAR